MLNRFFPTEHHKTIFDIDFEKLYQEGYRGLMFDIDNTLAPFDELDANDQLVQQFKWLNDMGFRICLVSNNNRIRVQRFNERLKVHAVHNSLKPFRIKLKRAMAHIGCDKTNTILIGDQLFTDIWGGNRLGIKTIFVHPIQEKEQWITKIKRNVEKKLLDYYLEKEQENAKH